MFYIQIQTDIIFIYYFLKSSILNLSLGFHDTENQSFNTNNHKCKVFNLLPKKINETVSP